MFYLPHLGARFGRYSGVLHSQADPCFTTSHYELAKKQSDCILQASGSGDGNLQLYLVKS
jgi:hypothetical protein